VLKRFLATRGRTDSRASWKRESRRHEGFPGQRRAEGIDVLLALDESGSISHEWYGSFFSEVESLARLSGARIRVVRFDTECSEPVSVRRFLAERTRLKGGSTDFAAVFAMADRHRAPLLVVFTDGDGPCPAHVNQRVLWLLTPDGRQPAPFGHAVRLSLPGMA
jgi:predicted metal-dependent peptidase